jgi:hypothetical protein
VRCDVQQCPPAVTREGGQEHTPPEELPERTETKRFGLDLGLAMESFPPSPWHLFKVQGWHVADTQRKRQFWHVSPDARLSSGEPCFSSLLALDLSNGRPQKCELAPVLAASARPLFAARCKDPIWDRLADGGLPCCFAQGSPP